MQVPNAPDSPSSVSICGDRSEPFATTAEIRRSGSCLLNSSFAIEAVLGSSVCLLNVIGARVCAYRQQFGIFVLIKIILLS